MLVVVSPTEVLGFRLISPPPPQAANVAANTLSAKIFFNFMRSLSSQFHKSGKEILNAVLLCVGGAILGDKCET